MKNQYFGDINDYFKYRLLRSAEKKCSFNIGLCWMLTPDDLAKKDGGKIGYLSREKEWRHFDPELFDFLHKWVVERRPKNIKVLEDNVKKSGVPLFKSIKFHSKSLADNKAKREDYFQEMFKAFSDRDIIFFDPDNGIEVKSIPSGRKNSSKYIYYDEIKKAYSKKLSVILFQHFHMGTGGEKRQAFIERLTGELKSRYKDAVVDYLRTRHVVFFFLIRPGHKACLLSLLREIKLDKKFSENRVNSIFNNK